MDKYDTIKELNLPEKSVSIVKKMIPIMIRWAKNGETTRTYGDLLHALGYKTFSGIGHQLYNVQAVFDHLSKREGEKIPTLNSLVKNGQTMLPSDGFAEVSPLYNNMDKAAKRIYVAGLDSEAIKYPYWDWVLDKLNLKPAKIFTVEELYNLSNHHYGSEGEGAEHKAIKEFICHNPNSIGVKDVYKAEMEYNLPSGDRLDVYFELKNGNRVAIEVKPSNSPDEDITRGIFQCVKYKAILDAIRFLRCDNHENVVILVIAGRMSNQNHQLADGLGIRYVDSFNKNNR